MSIDDVRVFMTVAAFLCFVGIVFWAYNRRREHDFDEAARLPFAGDDIIDDSRSGGGAGGQR